MKEQELLALPVLVDVPTAGRALGISRSTAYALARRGDLPVPVQRVGTQYRVRRTDLVAYVLGSEGPEVEDRGKSSAARQRWERVEDRSSGTQQARVRQRQSLDERLLKEIDPDGVMSETERAERLTDARSAYYRDLANRRWSRQ